MSFSMEDLNLVELTLLAYAAVSGQVRISEEDRSALLEAVFRREHEVRDLERMKEMDEPKLLE